MDPVERMACGAFAGICSVTATYPLDLIRTRLSLTEGGAQQTISSTIAQILRNEGGACALYKGLFPTLAGIAPYVALNFTVYEGLKSYFQTKNIDLSVDVKLACGGVAGAVAQTITYPFDVLRRRMQVSQSGLHSYNYKSSWEAVSMIWRSEGPLAFYKGLVPNYLKVVPAISISFVTFEAVKSAIQSVL